MRAHFAGNLEGDFQLCQRLPNIRRRNGAEHGTAFIANNVSLIPANNRRSGSRSIPDRQSLNAAGLFRWGLRTLTRYKQGNPAAR